MRVASNDHSVYLEDGVNAMLEACGPDCINKACLSTKGTLAMPTSLACLAWRALNESERAVPC